MANDFSRKAMKAKRNDGSYIFADFSTGLYLLDTPRGLGEQLASLALRGGRNIWSEKGSLIAQHGYMELGKLDEDDKLVTVTKETDSSNSIFIIGLSGTVYNYTAAQGLKKFKTTLDTVTRECLVARSNNNLVIYDSGTATLMGDYYEDATPVELDTDIPANDYGAFVELKIPIESKPYYWNGKKIDISGLGQYNIIRINDLISEGQTEPDYIIVRASYGKLGEEAPNVPSSVTINEKTILPIDLIFKSEDEEKIITIKPTLMEVANNRLFCVHTDGTIFYSAVGILDNFDESAGAGYFGGFYNDNSICLALDDYLNGVLIVKQNGLYYLSISNNVTVSSAGGLVSNSTIGVSVTKVANIGQEYASDHVIVREKIYAYDTNSQSLVLAATQNVFGSLVAGKTIVSSEYLSAQDMGISDSMRYLTYNQEAECFILYYGEGLNNGLVLTNQGSLFPRELDTRMELYLGFNQGVVGFTQDGRIVQDFKKGTIIRNISPVADFEAIGLKDNRCICASILEVTELNGIDFDLTVKNTSTTYQHIKPYINYGVDGKELPLLIYSDKSVSLYNNSYELSTKWADKKSNLTRVYAPMSGREGVSLSFEFSPNEAFCLAAIRLPDFSQGE